MWWLWPFGGVSDSRGGGVESRAWGTDNDGKLRDKPGVARRNLTPAPTGLASGARAILRKRSPMLDTDVPARPVIAPTALLEQVERYLSASDVEAIRRAFEFAAE